MSILFHYTSADGYTGILSSKRIRASLKQHNPKDARYGSGQYVSDILPGTKRPGQLSKLFLGLPWAGRRFTHYIGIETSRLEVIKGRQYVFLIKNTTDLDVSERIVKHGKN